jgi:hypothetical protein
MFFSIKGDFNGNKTKAEMEKEGLSLMAKQIEEAKKKKIEQ